MHVTMSHKFLGVNFSWILTAKNAKMAPPQKIPTMCCKQLKYIIMPINDELLVGSERGGDLLEKTPNDYHTAM